MDAIIWLSLDGALAMRKMRIKADRSRCGNRKVDKATHLVKNVSAGSIPGNSSLSDETVSCGPSHITCT